MNYDAKCLPLNSGKFRSSIQLTNSCFMSGMAGTCNFSIAVVYETNISSKVSSLLFITLKRCFSDKFLV